MKNKERIVVLVQRHGLITIPTSIRNKYRIKAGDYIRLDISEIELVLED